MQDVIEFNKKDMKTNKQYFDEKMMNITEDFKEMLASSTTSIMNQINTSKYSPSQKYSTKLPDPTTVVPVKKRSSPLDVGHSTKIGTMWTPKHEISSPNLHELLI